MNICKDCICRKYCGDDDIRRCDRYFRDSRIKKEPTNEEWFDGLSTEEKAEFLAKKCGEISCKFFLGEAEEIFSRYWVEWLKQPHQGENEK